MRGYASRIAPGLPLVSISVSFVALRFISWAEPRVLVRKSGDLAFTGAAFADRSQYFPWVQAVPVDEPIAQRRPPRVMNLPLSRSADRAPLVSATLWHDSQLEALRSLHHPWTLGLANGSTDRSSFKRYVAQDAYFLRAFAKAYAGALMKVDDEEGIRAFHSLIGSVLDELKLHASYAAKWGIDIQNVPPPVRATSDYVDFLLAVTTDPESSVAQVLASVTPCMRLYAFLGQELQHAFPRWRESPYAEWIETYGSEDFEAAAGLLESLLDKYSTETDYTTLLPLYRQAMDLEYAFFAAQSQGTPEDTRPAGHERSSSVTFICDPGAGVAEDTRPAGHDGSSVTFIGDPEAGVGERGDRGCSGGVQKSVALLCIDFDDTLTQDDTTSLLVKIAAAQGGTPADQARVESEWERLTNAFLGEWQEVMEESLADKSEGGLSTTSLNRAVDRQGLEKMLRRLEKVDLDSLTRVAESKVLRGITRESVRASLSQSLRSSWSMRPGVPAFLSRASMSQFPTHVLSINWSRDLITSALLETMEALNGKSAYSCSGGEGYLHHDGLTPVAPNNSLGKSPGRLSDDDLFTPISSNDLHYDEHGVSTGEISVKLTAAFGKWKRFLDLASATRASESVQDSSPRTLTIYIGDSVTDLLAMLDADVGIVVGSSSSFERVTSTFGIPIRPLVSAYETLHRHRGAQPHGVDGSSRPSDCVYRVSHWAEIEVFLFGHSR